MTKPREYLGPRHRAEDQIIRPCIDDVANNLRPGIPDGKDDVDERVLPDFTMPEITDDMLGIGLGACRFGKDEVKAFLFELADKVGFITGGDHRAEADVQKRASDTLPHGWFRVEKQNRCGPEPRISHQGSRLSKPGRSSLSRAWIRFGSSENCRPILLPRRQTTSQRTMPSCDDCNRRLFFSKNSPSTSRRAPFAEISRMVPLTSRSSSWMQALPLSARIVASHSTSTR